MTDAIARVRDAVSMDVTIDDVSISSASHSIYNESDTSGLASYCNLSELNLTQSEGYIILALILNLYAQFVLNYRLSRNCQRQSYRFKGDNS